MTGKRSFGGLLHRATHRIPGVPDHVERPTGHQGTAVHGRAVRRADAAHPSRDHGSNHSPAHPARFLPTWQRRVAAFFGQDF